MDDLRVDFQLLEQSARMLSATTSDFAQAETRAADYGMSVGSADIAAALGDFAGNWANHRRHLQNSTENLSQLVTETARSFRETDTALGTGLRA